MDYNFHISCHPTINLGEKKHERKSRMFKFISTRQRQQRRCRRRQLFHFVTTRLLRERKLSSGGKLCSEKKGGNVC